MKKWKQLTGTDRILYALSVLLVAAILWYWQTGTDNGTLNKVLLSSPENVLKSFTQLWGKGSLQKHILVSFQRVMTGFLFGAGAGIILGFILAAVPALKNCSVSCWG